MLRGQQVQRERLQQQVQLGLQVQAQLVLVVQPGQLGQYRLQMDHPSAYHRVLGIVHGAVRHLRQQRRRRGGQGHAHRRHACYVGTLLHDEEGG